MADIIRQGPTGDGYDVMVVSAGKPITLHFLSQPTTEQLTDRIDTFEQMLTDECAVVTVIESEELD